MPASRVRISNQDKLKVIQLVEAGKTHEQAAQEYGVSRTTVTKLLQKKEMVTQRCQTTQLKKRKVLDYHHHFSMIEEMLWQWHASVEINAPSLSITSAVLRSKALEFKDKVLEKHAADLPYETVEALQGFKASNGWLQRYLARTKTANVQKCGERGSANPEGMQDRLALIRRELEGVALENIWNVDETALLYKSTSTKSYVTTNADGRGVKRLKDRITVTPIVNAAGGKMALQVIGKRKTPRALRGVNVFEVFGIHYEAQKNAWQNNSSFLQLLQRMNRMAAQKNVIYYILMDNCSPHVIAAKSFRYGQSPNDTIKYENIVVLFLPPNSTSYCQPLDQGIIRSFKAGFRKAQLRTLLLEYERWQIFAESESPGSAGKFDPNAHTHLRNALSWIQEAWNGVTENTIQRCFVKSNCLPLLAQTDANVCILRGSTNSRSADNDLSNLEEMMAEISLHEQLASSLGVTGALEQVDQLLSLDSEILTSSDFVDEDEIVESIVCECLDAPADVEDCGDSSDAVELVTPKQACKAIQEVLAFVEVCDTTIVPADKKQHVISTMRNLQPSVIRFIDRNRQNKSKQTSVKDFFPPSKERCKLSSRIEMEQHKLSEEEENN